MNVKDKLDKLRFRTFTKSGLVTDVREYVDNLGAESIAVKLFVVDLIGREIDFPSDLEARLFVKKLVVELYDANFIINPIEIDNVVDECWEYVRAFIADPKWSFLLTTSEEDNDEGNESSKSFSKPVTKVVKKESKQDIVRRWYKEFVLDNGMASKEFGLKLVSELGMSKAGSLTYVFNAKKFWAEGGV